MAALGDEALFAPPRARRPGHRPGRPGGRSPTVPWPSWSSAAPGPRSRSSSADERESGGRPDAPRHPTRSRPGSRPAGWPSTSATRSAMASRPPPATATPCSTARPLPTACGRPAGSASAMGVTPADRAARIEDLLTDARPRPGRRAGPARAGAGGRPAGRWPRDKKHAGGRAALGAADGRLRRDPGRRPGGPRRAGRRRPAGPAQPACAGRPADDPGPRPPGSQPEPARDRASRRSTAGRRWTRSTPGSRPGRPSWAWPSTSSSRTTRAP